MTPALVALKRYASVPVVAGLNVAAGDGPDDWPRLIRTTDIAGPRQLGSDIVRVDPHTVGDLDLKPGDLLFSRTGSVGTVHLFSGGQSAAFAGYLVRVRVDRRVAEPRFLGYWSQSSHAQRQIAAGTIRSTIDNFNATKVGNLRVPDLPLPQQRDIAAFLDVECERMSELQGRAVRARSYASELAATTITRVLEAQRHRMTHQKVAWHVAFMSGFTFKSELFVHDATQGVRLARGINVAPGLMRWADTVYWPHDHLHEVKEYSLREGDLLVGLNRPWVSTGLRLARIRESDLPALLLQRVGCIRPLQGSPLKTEYLELWMKTERFRHEVGDASAVTFPMLEPRRLLGWRLPVPSEADQATTLEMAAGRSTDASRISQAFDLLGRRLSEYRDALITEAVTGQLDVTAVSESRMDERLHEATEAPHA